MSDESNALLALKNAWAGVVDISDEVRALLPAVDALPADTPLASVDFETYRRLTLAQSNAVFALRGLVEQMQQRTGAASADESADRAASES